MPRWPKPGMTREEALRRRRELYLWRKLCGFCVGCRRYIGEDAETVYCARCCRNQAKWAKRNPELVRDKTRRWRARRARDG